MRAAHCWEVSFLLQYPETHMKSTLRHRHFVAVPLFAVFMASSLVSTSFLAGSVFSNSPRTLVSPSENTRYFADGTVSQSFDRTEILEDDGWPVLVHGALMMKGESIVRLSVGNAELIGWNGAFHASRNGAHIVVSAVSTPVLMRTFQGDHIVPVHMQWEGGELSSIPTDQLRSLLRDDRSLQPRDLVAPPAPENVLGMTVPTFLEFPHARMRRATDRSNRAIHALWHALQTVMKADAINLLTNTATQRLLRDDPLARRYGPSLLSIAVRREGFATFLVPAIVQDRDLWMLLSFHPLVQALTWEQSVPASVPPETILRLLTLLPQSDILPQPVFVSVYKRWATLLSDQLHTEQQSPTAILVEIEPVIRQSLSVFATLGYRERTQILLDAFSVAIADVRSTLTPELLREIQGLHARPSQNFEAAPLMDDANGTSILPAARTLLSAIGATDIPTTTYDLLDGHTLQIADIAFEEHRCSFHFDLRLDQFSSILVDNVAYPFPVERDQFAAWIARL